jgi:hypothetical protein
MENQEQIFEFNIPAGVQDTRVEPAIIAGAEKSKSPFETSQRESAAFANRMVAANAILNAIEESGFNPVNAKDIAIENAPFIPKLFEGFIQPSRHQGWLSCKCKSRCVSCTNKRR